MLTFGKLAAKTMGAYVYIFDLSKKTERPNSFISECEEDLSRPAERIDCTPFFEKS
jgi:hypothetical protein